MQTKQGNHDVSHARSNAENLFRRAKLLAPSAAARVVARADIAELVARSVGAKLILFRAPAGFGKSTGMRQYLDHLQENRTATAWLTLDPLDDDFLRLLIHLIAAFDAVLRPQGPNAQIEEVAPAVGDIDQLAFDLMDKIANCEHPFTLFIDDFDSVSNRAIDDLLRLILTRLPSHGQLVIASREMPNLQLGRLRAHGHLVEIDQLRLRFSRTETDVFLRTQRALELTEEDVTKLHSDTEGWPAALWLVATALEKRENPELFIATFSGSNAAVAEYLAEDVLSQQPKEVQSFLLKTSILGELSTPLCDALCAGLDSETLLKRLEQSNVCVTTIDSERSLYRYHGLFAGFLRAQLDRLYPHEIAGLHRTAAKWYQAEGRPIPAIEHALASGETAYAYSLIDAHVDSLLFQGRFRLLARWLDKLPQEQLPMFPRLRIAHIWALTFTRRSADALRRLDDFVSDRDLSDGELTDHLVSETEVLRTFILGILDRHEEAYRLAEQTLLKSTPATSFSYNILTTALATFKLGANRYAEAIDLLKYPCPQSPGNGKTFPTVYAICMEGLVDLVQGRVRQAIAQFRVALSEAAATFGSRSIGKSIAAVYLAEALYEVDELQEAEQLLVLYLPIAKEYGLPDQVIISHIIQARIAHDRGDVDHAFRRLSELEYFGRQGNLPRVFAAVQLERARLALLRDDPAEAQSHFERATNSSAWDGLRGVIMQANDVETVALCRYRLFVRGIGKDDVMQTLKDDINTAQGSSRNRNALKLRILFATALQASGQKRLAMRTTEDVLKVAVRDGVVRTFLDEGAPVIELLRAFRIARTASPELAPDNELVGFVDRILRRAGLNLDLALPEDPAIDMSATFTARELQILESLALGLSNIAIASNLFVTESTVRAHLRKVNVKLGASNRTQAVSVARRLGLIK